MALQLGTENKKQVIIVSVLFLGDYRHRRMGTLWLLGKQIHSTAHPRATCGRRCRPSRGIADTLPWQSSQGPEAEKLTNDGLDPTVHFDKLAETEDVEYSGTGRNIFSADSAPAPIETLVKGPRAVQQAAASAVPAGPAPYVPPKPPAIDLKYFGYTQAKDKSMKAFLIHGDDIFMAKPAKLSIIAIRWSPSCRPASRSPTWATTTPKPCL